jgi:uncharacterized membrane protein
MPVWLRIVLFASLATNLLIVGAVIGAVVMHGGPRVGDHLAGVRDLGPAPFVQAFEPEMRRALVADLRREAGPLRQNRNDLRQRFEALLAALRAETFDRPAVERLIAEQRTLAVTRQEIGQSVLLDALESMPRSARLDYADRLDRSLRRDRR